MVAQVLNPLSSSCPLFLFIYAQTKRLTNRLFNRPLSDMYPMQVPTFRAYWTAATSCLRSPTIHLSWWTPEVSASGIVRTNLILIWSSSMDLEARH